MNATRHRPKESTEVLVQRLEANPLLKARISRILDLAENTDGEVITADEAEERAIQELRKLGQELLQGWGQRVAETEAQKLSKHPGVKAHLTRMFHKLPARPFSRR